jgi:hypothetical protein
MKRKEFIRNISLVGAGISLAPTRLFANSNTVQIALPIAATHIPHGNFAGANLERILIEEMNIEVSIQHFLRTGIESSDKDISVFTFHRENEVLNVCFDAEGCHTSGKIAGFESRNSDNQFSIRNNRFEVKLKAGSFYLSLRKV